MSALLFVFSIAGFVMIAWWAYQNDKLELHERGTGLLAMASSEVKPKPLPKWKKATGAVVESPRRLSRLKAPADDRKAGWKRTLHYGRGR